MVGATDLLYEEGEQAVQKRVEFSNNPNNREQFFFNNDVVSLTLIQDRKATSIDSSPDALERIRGLSKEEKAH